MRSRHQAHRFADIFLSSVRVIIWEGNKLNISKQVWRLYKKDSGFHLADLTNCIVSAPKETSEVVLKSWYSLCSNFPSIGTYGDRYWPTWKTIFTLTWINNLQWKIWESSWMLKFHDVFFLCQPSFLGLNQFMTVLSISAWSFCLICVSPF